MPWYPHLLYYLPVVLHTISLGESNINMLFWSFCGGKNACICHIFILANFQFRWTFFSFSSSVIVPFDYLAYILLTLTIFLLNVSCRLLDFRKYACLIIERIFFASYLLIFLPKNPFNHLIFLLFSLSYLSSLS